jgi:hypothetical protein
MKGLVSTTHAGCLLGGTNWIFNYNTEGLLKPHAIRMAEHLLHEIQGIWTISNIRVHCPIQILLTYRTCDLCYGLANQRFKRRTLLPVLPYLFDVDPVLGGETVR